MRQVFQYNWDVPRKHKPSGSKRRRVLLLGAQPLLCQGLESILDGLKDVEVIGSLDPEADGLDRLPNHAPDVVLLAEEDSAHGLHSGTEVVTVGAAELFGTAFGVGK